MTTGSRMAQHTLDMESRHLEPTQKGNDEILERSYSYHGETRRSSVQIRPAPPKTSFTKLCEAG
jgi:hypothetical protein